MYTNPAAFENGVLRVRPHHAEPPLCDGPCPDNMCKGKVRHSTPQNNGISAKCCVIWHIIVTSHSPSCQ